MKLKILIYFGVEKNALRNSVINDGREFKKNKTVASNRGNTVHEFSVNPVSLPGISENIWISIPGFASKGSNLVFQFSSLSSLYIFGGVESFNLKQYKKTQ